MPCSHNNPALLLTVVLLPHLFPVPAQLACPLDGYLFAPVFAAPLPPCWLPPALQPCAGGLPAGRLLALQEAAGDAARPEPGVPALHVSV